MAIRDSDGVEDKLLRCFGVLGCDGTEQLPHSPVWTQRGTQE